ncbi:MAG: hypothetical protein K5851_05645 [Lachnospiraceae bacterium]|nr:hypothetical protein [Lachnospiraceae bacterium]
MRVSKSGKSFQYYLRENPKNKNGTYIPKAKIEIAKALAQRDYEKKALAYAKAELVNVTTYLAYMKVNNLISVLDSFGEGRQRLITPIYRMETDFVEAWKSIKYKGRDFGDINTEFFTSNGVRVASKSELAIANMLEAYNIPYRYEYPLILSSGKKIWPDFLCLNVRTRKEIIWEHFGMMDNIGYANRNVEKINLYAKDGYCLGENFVATFETSQVQLNLKTVQRIIEEFLL